MLEDVRLDELSVFHPFQRKDVAPARIDVYKRQSQTSVNYFKKTSFMPFGVMLYLIEIDVYKRQEKLRTAADQRFTSLIQ